MSRRYTADGKRISSMQHAKHPSYCACGKIVHGNGARAMHFYIDGNRANGYREGHRRINQEAHFAQYRRCSTCDGMCLWTEDAWVCGKCGNEWYPDHDRFYYAPPEPAS